MKYRIESIGASFSSREIAALSDRLTGMSADGWELHTVFSVHKRGCLGFNEGTTYLAVFRASDD